LRYLLPPFLRRAAGSCLRRHAAQPSRHVPSAWGGLSVADCWDQCRRMQHPDAGNGRPSPGVRVGPRPHGELLVECFDLPVERLPLRPHVLQQAAHPRNRSGVPSMRQDAVRACAGLAGQQFRAPSVPRAQLVSSAVRSPTRRSRTRCNICMSSCSSALSWTKRIMGRVSASAIALLLP